MITRPTTFVLGAGASAPYGFPTGNDLADQIVNVLDRGRMPTELRRRLTDFVPSETIDRFVKAYRRAGRNSLDAFVQSRPEFLALVKHAIVLKLSTYEQEVSLYPDARPSADWYRYLFDRLIGGTPEEFRSNRVRVITFNFDRSFERRMHLALEAAYGLTSEDAAMLATAVPIIHPHGMIGLPTWNTRSRGPQYRDYTLGVEQEQISQCASMIRIVHEEIDAEQLEKAHDWLRASEYVVFLGFGYHPTNVVRLTAGSLNTNIVGSALGFTEAEIVPIKKMLGRGGGAVILRSDLDCLGLLRHTDVLHG